MSILLDTSTDTLQRTLTSGLTISSAGEFNMGIWANFQSDVNARRILFVTGPTDGGSPMLGVQNNATGLQYTSLYTAGNQGTASANKSISTWYWLALSRNGSGNIRLRIFDDSTSTTPLDTISNGPDATDYGTAQDEVSIGDPGHGLGSANVELCLFKIHTTTEWTNAECRAESQLFGIQKSGGTDRYCWALEDIDADQYGINEYGGSGQNFTNSGAVNGASRPSQLESVGGSSAVLGRSAQLNTTQGRPVQLRPTGINPFTFVR